MTQVDADDTPLKDSMLMSCRTAARHRYSGARTPARPVPEFVLGAGDSHEHASVLDLLDRLLW